LAHPTVGAHSWIPRTLSVSAFCAFLVLAWSLGRIEWEDAYVAAFLDTIRGCEEYPLIAWVNRAAAYLGIALVGSAAAVALKRGATRADVVRLLTLLAVGLLLVEGLKLLVLRERPGGLGHPIASSSFPSGHVANAALCVAAAIALVGRREDRRDFVRAAVMGIGSLFVIAVAFTRLYVGLHWLSDVMASVLLGIIFGGMLDAGATATRAILPAMSLLALPIYVMVACGFRVMLPSPTSLATSQGNRASHAGLRLQYRFPHGSALRQWRLAERRPLAMRGDLRLGLETSDNRGALLTLVGNSSLAPSSQSCGWLQLFVDDTARGELRLEDGWWTYAFALPRLNPGLHRVRLHLVFPLPSSVLSDSPFTLRTLQIASPAGIVPAS